jgi:hypothetical protein
MFGYEYIKQCQRDYAREQAALEAQPFVVWDVAEAHDLNVLQVKELPAFYTYRAHGYYKVASFTVDTAGYLSRGEISIEQFQNQLGDLVAKHNTIGLAILDEGSGWVEVGAFKKVRRN